MTKGDSGDLSKTRLSEMPVPEEVWREIMSAGVQAPSGDNIQPWSFSRTADGSITLTVKPWKNSFFDADRIVALISAGCVLENIRVAATAYGLRLKILEFFGGESDDRIARFEFELSGEPRDFHHEIVLERCVNRRDYDRQPIPPGNLEDLRGAAESMPGMRLHVITERAELRELARLVYLAEMIRIERRDIHEELHQKLRFTSKEVHATRDGFPLGNLMAGWLGEMYLRISHPWKIARALNLLGMSRAAAYYAYKGVITSSGAAFLTSPSLKPRDLVRGGQALERMWLELTLKELAMQPLSALCFFHMRYQMGKRDTFSPRHQNILDKVWPRYHALFPGLDSDKAGQVMLCRLGYAAPIEIRTLRRLPAAFQAEGITLGSRG